MIDGNALEKRSKWLTAVFLLAVLAVSFRTLQFAVFSREKYIRAGEKIALFRGTIPARRGILYDKNRIMLAWNERYFQLYSTLPAGETFQSRHLDRLQEIFPDRLFPADGGGGEPLRYNLNVQEILALEHLIKSGAPLEIRSRTDRIQVSTGNARDALGKVENNLGLDGIEKKYNQALCGKDGAFEVMLDRRRNWIHSSWKLIRAPEHGKNVVLPWSLKEISTGRVKL